METLVLRWLTAGWPRRFEARRVDVGHVEAARAACRLAAARRDLAREAWSVLLSAGFVWDYEQRLRAMDRVIEKHRREMRRLLFGPEPDLVALDLEEFRE